MSSSIRSLFVHTTHALLGLQEVSLGCICTHCYNALPLAKRLRS